MARSAFALRTARMRSTCAYTTPLGAASFRRGSASRRRTVAAAFEDNASSEISTAALPPSMVSSRASGAPASQSLAPRLRPGASDAASATAASWSSASSSSKGMGTTVPQRRQSPAHSPTYFCPLDSQ